MQFIENFPFITIVLSLFSAVICFAGYRSLTMFHRPKSSLPML